ncbi:MAG: FAD:protein FMN transferase [Arenibacterium sp.]
MINRRRFLTISCAALGAPALAAPTDTWRGYALGAEVSISIQGFRDQTTPALARARALIRHVERQFSLYDPESALSRLNRNGVLHDPHPDFLALCVEIDRLYARTNGLFDPTVQVLWQRKTDERLRATLKALIGWPRVTHHTNAVHLAPGQQLTFNGIAQGFATDLVTGGLRDSGFTNLHVNIGEHATQGPARRLGIADPNFGIVGAVSLKNAAVATSSPNATQMGHQGHIFSPFDTGVHWSTVSVVAPRATLADGLSTALCLADWADVRRIHGAAGSERYILIDAQGDVRSL